ncbi:MAG: hypothetical protein M3Z27_06765 [Actinomycetota bacterium]|nr:hypothetical protein [Actinomycetota bacterium]
MIALLRATTRLVGMIWTLALALTGLGVALYCVDDAIRLGSIRPDRLLHLVSVRRHVGHFLTQVTAPGPTAGLALLCGLGAILLGALLLAGILSVRERRAVLDDDRTAGRLTARPKAIRDIARALAETFPGAPRITAAKLTLSRRGRRGRLKLTAIRTSDTEPRQIREALQARLRPLSEPFSLRTRIRIRLRGPGDAGR